MSDGEGSEKGEEVGGEEEQTRAGATASPDGERRWGPGQWGRTKPREVKHLREGTEYTAWACTVVVTVEEEEYFDTYYAVPKQEDGEPAFTFPCHLPEVEEFLNFRFTSELNAFYDRFRERGEARWNALDCFQEFLRFKRDDGFPHGFSQYVYRERMSQEPGDWDL